MKKNKGNNSKYNINAVLAIMCNIVSLFIFGYLFSGIAYGLFDDNYKNSLDNERKRKNSIIGKAISSFFIFMSLSYHGQSRNMPIDERMAVSFTIGLIFSIVCFCVLNSKDKKLTLEEIEKMNAKNKDKIKYDEEELKELDKQNKKLGIILAIMVLLIIVPVIIILLLPTDEGKEKKSKEETIKQTLDLNEKKKEQSCSFTKSYDVSRVEIAAESDAGVGDIFSKPNSYLGYKIKDNKIGDIYNVNYKLSGDSNDYNCNEYWYNVTLSDGATGYIWGGYKGMYVHEK